MDGKMMRKILLSVVFLIWSSAVGGCTGSQPTVEYPPIDLLLIDESVFPEGWVAKEPDWEHPPRAPWSGRTRMVEYIDRRFYTRSGGGAAASITIRQFDSPRAAAREYERRVDVTFRVRDEKWGTPWVAPDELSFESPAADKYRYACATEGYFPQINCAYVAQYGVYTLDFDVKLYDTKVITYADLLPVFQAIDERMMSTLNSE